MLYTNNPTHNYLQLDLEQMKLMQIAVDVAVPTVDRQLDCPTTVVNVAVDDADSIVAIVSSEHTNL